MLKQLFKKMYIEGTEEQVELAMMYLEELKPIEENQETTDKDSSGDYVTDTDSLSVLGYTIDEDYDITITEIVESYHARYERKFNKIIELCNMKKISELSGMSYDSLKSYSCGRYKMNFDNKKQIVDKVEEYLK